MWECLTHVELTEQLQPGVALRGGQPRHPVRLVQLEHRLFNVPLSDHPVPLVVVQGSGRVDVQLDGPVPNVEGEGEHFRSCRIDRGKRKTFSYFYKTTF